MKPLTEGKTLSGRKDPPKSKRPKSPPPPIVGLATWTWDWPQVEGYFWVYGFLYASEKEMTLHQAKAYKSLAGKMSYAVNGQFYYQSDTGLVMWSKVEPPPMLPTAEIMSRNMFPDGK